MHLIFILLYQINQHFTISWQKWSKNVRALGVFQNYLTLLKSKNITKASIYLLTDVLEVHFLELEKLRNRLEISDADDPSLKLMIHH